jgi:hypothetical protein
VTTVRCDPASHALIAAEARNPATRFAQFVREAVLARAGVRQALRDGEIDGAHMASLAHTLAQRLTELSRR